MMVAGAYKIVAQEFRAEATMPLFLSLLLYGGMLLVIPKLLQRPVTPLTAGPIADAPAQDATDSQAQAHT
jgi:hypothetical protein